LNNSVGKLVGSRPHRWLVNKLAVVTGGAAELGVATKGTDRTS
jgi:hypothetical protein